MEHEPFRNGFFLRRVRLGHSQFGQAAIAHLMRTVAKQLQPIALSLQFWDNINALHQAAGLRQIFIKANAGKAGQLFF